jgi:hypothetical protein
MKNSRKTSFLASIPTISLDDNSNSLTIKCKFNFSYFDVQNGISQDFQDWSYEELVKLLEKFKNYSEFSLTHWQREKVGKYSVFVVYDQFPINTDFTKPKHIPHQALWARFHLENMVRVIGFVIPDEYADKAHPKTASRFDTNTFYIVYLDKEHRFYKTER